MYCNYSRRKAIYEVSSALTLTVRQETGANKIIIDKKKYKVIFFIFYTGFAGEILRIRRLTILSLSPIRARIFLYEQKRKLFKDEKKRALYFFTKRRPCVTNRAVFSHS